MTSSPWCSRPPSSPTWLASSPGTSAPRWPVGRPSPTRDTGLWADLVAAPIPDTPGPHVIGLDLSLTATGISDGRWCDTITTTGATRDQVAARAARIAHITTTVLEYTRGVDLVVVEGPAPSRHTGKVWDRAGLWWRVVARLLDAETPVAVVSPSGRARYATGRGNAPKDQVLAAAVRRYPGVPIGNNNEADATILAAMGLDRLGCPLATVPQSHRAALDAVEWPDHIGDTPA